MNIFKNLYQYRELLKTNVQKEVRGKYKNSFLGVLWSFLNPLLQICVYAIVFPLILKNNQPNYVIFLCVALIPWTFFTTCVQQSASTMIQNGNIIKKVYFTREILPISVVTSGMINFIISTVIIFAFLIIYHVGITKYIVFFPVILVVQYILQLGISFIVSSVTVYLRDLEHLIGVALQLLFYGTPIVYAAESIPEDFKFIIQYNPMTYIINGYRNIFYDQTMPDLHALAILFVISILVCVVGYMIFKKLQKGFAEEL